MRGRPERILQIIDDFAGEQDFLYNLGSHKGMLLRQIIAQTKATSVIELGGYVGYSAILAADEMTKHTIDRAAIRLWSLEIDANYAAIASRLVELAGLDDIVKVVVGEARSSLQYLVEQRLVLSADVILLDHPEELYLPDFQLCESLHLFHQSTIIVADNVARPGAPEYRTYVRAQPHFSSIGVRGLLMPGEFEV
jgi:catechol O-methyltransferase